MKLFRAFASTMILSSAALLGCSGGETSPAAGGGGDAASSDAIADVVIGEGGIGDGGTEASPVTGYVRIIMDPYDLNAWTRWATPFLASSSIPLGSCVIADALAAPPTDAAAPNPGTIAVMGPNINASIDYNKDGYYATYQVPSGTRALFAPGDTLTFSSAGATLPAIAPLTLTIPSDSTFALTTPARCDASLCGDVSRLQDFRVEWTPTSGTVMLVSGQGESGGVHNVVSCNFDPKAGYGVLPASLLRHLSPGIFILTAALFASADSNDGTWAIKAVATLGEDLRSMTAH